MLLGSFTRRIHEYNGFEGISRVVFCCSAGAGAWFARRSGGWFARTRRFRDRPFERSDRFVDRCNRAFQADGFDDRVRRALQMCRPVEHEGCRRVGLHQLRFDGRPCCHLLQPRPRLRQCLFLPERWVLFKQDTHETMTVTELKQKAAEANLLTKAVLDAFKVFAKETLSEFRK